MPEVMMALSIRLSIFVSFKSLKNLTKFTNNLIVNE